MSVENEGSVTSSNSTRLTKLRWLLFVLLNVVFLIVGQTSAVLLGRFYYKQGGSSIFMATLVQSSGFPILFIPLLLLPFPANHESASPTIAPSYKQIFLLYIALGILITGDNLLYSIGLLYLSSSTYSLIATTQLVFNVAFSYLLNSQRLTPLILNSVAVVTFSAALLAVNESSDAPSGVSKIRYALGLLCTLAASALYSFLLSLMELAFQKVLKKETFYVVVEMQIWTSVVSTILSLAGLFISGQWRSIGGEIAGFRSGRNSYVMTLVWAAACWQLCSVGVVGLVFLVSSLFSNVISSVGLAVAPVASVIAFRERMNGVKIIAMLQAFWGLGSYAYQQHLDARLEAESRETSVLSDDGSGA